MNTSKTLTLAAALVLLAAGCSKKETATENDVRLRIFAEEMASTGSKVVINPSAVNAASWVENEQINLNGTTCTIKGNSTDGYYLDGVNPLSSVMYAIYPAGIMHGGNHIAVTNVPGGDCVVAIHSLTIDFSAGNGNQKVYFPMAAMAEANSTALRFKHLTGGLRLTLNNACSYNMELDSLIFGAVADGGNDAIYKNQRPSTSDWPSWPGGVLPALPSGEVGNTSQNQGAEFVRTMSVSLRNGNRVGLIIPANSSVTFCIPMLTRSFTFFYCEGFYRKNLIFHKEKNITGTLEIQRNTMYTLPTIDID